QKQILLADNISSSLNYDIKELTSKQNSKQRDDLNEAKVVENDAVKKDEDDVNKQNDKDVNNEKNSFAIDKKNDNLVTNNTNLVKKSSENANLSNKKNDNIDCGKHITITKDEKAKTENENKLVNNKMFEITNDRQVVEQVDSIKVERKNGKRIVTKKLRNDKKTGQ
ncbi:MAG: hypothetical protein ACI4TT_01355, partial [Christensenellales bacterium]